MTVELMKKLEELSKDKEFLEGLSKQTSESAIKEYLKSKNVGISDEEFAEIASYVSKYVKGELSDEEMEAISGGFDWEGFGKGFLYGFTKTLSFGLKLL